jgi:hypothetical protein
MAQRMSCSGRAYLTDSVGLRIIRRKQSLDEKASRATWRAKNARTVAARLTRHGGKPGYLSRVIESGQHLSFDNPLTGL